MVCQGTVSKPISVCTQCHSPLGYGLFLPARITWYFPFSALCKEDKCPKCASRLMKDGRVMCEICYGRTKLEVKRVKKELEEVKTGNKKLQITLDLLRYTAASSAFHHSEALKAASSLLTLQRHSHTLQSEVLKEHIHTEALHKQRCKAQIQISHVRFELQKWVG